MAIITSGDLLAGVRHVGTFDGGGKVYYSPNQPFHGFSSAGNISGPAVIAIPLFGPASRSVGLKGYGYRIDSLQLDAPNGGGANTKKVRAGIYASTGSLPGALVADFGEITLATGTNIYTWTPTAYDLDGDTKYYLGSLWEATTTGINGIYNPVLAGHTEGYSTSTTAAITGWYKSGITYASGFPDPFPTSTATPKADGIGGIVVAFAA